MIAVNNEMTYNNVLENLFQDFPPKLAGNIVIVMNKAFLEKTYLKKASSSSTCQLIFIFCT